jgi:hypothetical protein
LRTRDTTDYFDPAVARIQAVDTVDIKNGPMYRFHHGVSGGRQQTHGQSQTGAIQPATHHIRHQVLETIDGRLQRSRLMVEDMNGEFSFSDVISDYQVIYELRPHCQAQAATTITCTHRVTNASVLMVMLFGLVNAPRRTLYHLGRSLAWQQRAETEVRPAPASPQD